MKHIKYLILVCVFSANLYTLELNESRTDLSGQALTVGTVDTGQGANELYDMNQNVETTSEVTFVTVTISGFFNIGTVTEYTLNSSSAITVTVMHVKVDTEGDASAGELKTINGGTTNDILVLRSENSSRDVTLKDGTDNLLLEGDFVLTDNTDYIMLIKSGSNWIELNRSNNN